MLSVTKLQTTNNNFIFNELEIKTPIEQIISIIKNQYPTRNFEFIYKNSTPNVFVDKDKFQQIMTNLIENGAKYSTENSTIRITTNFSSCDVKISVTNLGPGIAQEDYERIFTKFARIDNPLTRKVQGSGLGLYITKNLVEKMCGQISVTSKPTQTPDLSEITFTLTLPIRNIEEQARLKCSQ